MEAIACEFQHALVIADMDKSRIRKVVRKTCAERKKITLLIDVKIRKRFEEKVNELVDVGATNMWGHFKDGALQSCDEVCGKKMGRRSKGDTWWWNEEVKEAVLRRKEAHKVMCQDSIVENKGRYEGMKKKASNAFSKAMREMAEEALNELQNCPYGMLRIVKGLKTDCKEVEGGRCMR